MFPFRSSGPFCSLRAQQLPARSEFRSMNCNRWISNGSCVGWGRAGEACRGPQQPGFMLVSHWSVTVEILPGVKGLVLANGSKGGCCPFIVNVNVKENMREALLVVRGNIIITSKTRLKHVTPVFIHMVTFTVTFL